LRSKVFCGIEGEAESRELNEASSGLAQYGFSVLF